MAAKRRKKQTPGPRSHRIRATPDVRLALADTSGVFTAHQPPLALRIALPILVAACAFVTYWPALGAGFVNWDDDKAIVDNPRIRGFNWNWVFTQSKMGHYHPLTWLSYSVDHAIGNARFDGLNTKSQARYEAGLDPFIFHLNNLLLHAGVAVAFYCLARLLLRITLPPPAERTDWLSPLAACVAALLFACHPLRVENVVWVTERRDVLSAIFLLPCLHCYLRYAISPRRGAARVTWYCGALLLLVLSLLSKAWGITLPAVMLLIDYHPLRRFGRDAGWRGRRALVAYLDKLPFIVVAAWFAYKAKTAQASQLATMKSLADWGIADRILQVFYGLLFYTWKTLIPTGLTPLRQIPPIRATDLADSTSPVVRDVVLRFLYTSLVAAVIVIAVAALLIVLRKRWPAGIIMGLIYAGTLSPILGIAQSGPQVVADKYAYIGCLVWPLAAAAGLIWLWRKRRDVPWARLLAPAASALSIALCATYAALALQQSKIWNDSYTLWSHAVEVDPHCVLARNNLGMLERQRNNVDTAIAHYEAALEVDPADPIVLNNYANALRQDPARLAEAIEIFRRAVALRPKMPELHYALASALIDAGMLDDAVAELNTCVRLHRDQPRPKYHRALGRIHLSRKNYDAAEKEYQRALALELRLDSRGVGVIDAYDRLGWISLYRKQPAEAARWFNRILEIDPQNRSALTGLARAQSLTG